MTFFKLVDAATLSRGGDTMKRYTADLETTAAEQYERDGCVRAWAVNVTDIDTGENILTANNLDDFFKWLGKSNKAHDNRQIYFHNLKFDGTYLLTWLFERGFKHLTEDEPPEEYSFKTLITDTGIWYSITIYFKIFNKRYNKVEILDSFKKLPFSVRDIAKAFNLPVQKGDLDYNTFRELGHELTEEEREYLLADTGIMAQALKTQFAQGLDKMTIASDAMANFKGRLGAGFDYLFPVLNHTTDADIRRAYKGGFVYLNPKHADKELTDVISYDVNSLYPSVLYSTKEQPHPMPYGVPVYFDGQYTRDDDYPLYIQHLRAEFELKPGHIPTVQIKNNPRFIETEYLTHSDNELVDLVLTSIDLKLLLDHYHVKNIEYINGFKFRAVTGLFNSYIDYWITIKNENTGALRTIAKLMLNSLYGKFGTNPRKCQSIPVYVDGVLNFKIGEDKLEKPVYTALACYVTAYARDVTIRTAQRVFDRFIYADTDSIHLIGLTPPDNIDVDAKRLGAWKFEGAAQRAKFIRAKTYLKEKDGELCVTCAGMPSNVKQLVTFENFNKGSVYPGKLLQRRVKGGALLLPTEFTIKDDSRHRQPSPVEVLL